VVIQDGSGASAPVLGEAPAVELMNTVWADRDGAHDALATPGQALAWLRIIRDRLAPRPAAVDAWLDSAQPGDATAVAHRLRELRDGLRRLAAEATGDPRPAAVSATPDRRAALLTLDHACAAAPTWSSLRWVDGQEPSRELHTDAPPEKAIVAELAEQAVELFTGEPARRLRACLAPGCVLYFVKQHPRREWCSAGCGNRARVARHYQRHRTQTTNPTR
jgi:predicted RNA-binding Zn ribbon-like protein